MRLRLAGQGSVGRRKGPPGDLYAFVTVQPHPELRRDGKTIYAEVSVRHRFCVPSVAAAASASVLTSKVPARCRAVAASFVAALHTRLHCMTAAIRRTR